MCCFSWFFLFSDQRDCLSGGKVFSLGKLNQVIALYATYPKQKSVCVKSKSMISVHVILFQMETSAEEISLKVKWRVATLVLL